MTLRRRFILALVSMVIFMAIVSGSISLLSVNLLLDRSVSYVQQNFINQWNRVLVSYYEEQGSWEGVQYQVLHIMTDPRQRDGGLFRDNMKVLVFDKNYSAIAGLGPDIGENISRFRDGEKIKAKLSPILVGKEIVGYLWLEDNFAIRTTFVSRTLSSSIIGAMLIGLIITSLIALLLGVVLTRRLTDPLKRLTQAVTSVGQGNLSTRIEPEGSTDIQSLAKAFNQMTTQLAHTEEVRSKMVADIAHELRTPLTVISGKLESIQEGVVEATPETILPIQDEVIRMTRLVRDLQHLTLAEAGKLPLVMKKVDLEELIERILDHFVIALEEKEINTEITGQALTVEGDSDRLMQVFVNLIDNAIRHSRVGGSCRIEFQTGSWDEKSSENGVFIIIQDSGEGIPEEELHRIFDRFYRVDQARDRTSGGTGLGLAIAREFIQAHRGHLTVSSKKGEGTRFTVWIPTNSLDVGHQPSC
ncbi:MAG: hypothetical protein APF84_18670 [Gracilibacter sp. BRH_c7a]|nr:MAG: hypothetical protein APF84_18670 [Gracilibacter sp. BRH_c7a]